MAGALKAARYSLHLKKTFTLTHINGLVQERCNSSALAMELCLSCINTMELHLSYTTCATCWLHFESGSYPLPVLVLYLSCCRWFCTFLTSTCPLHNPFLIQYSYGIFAIEVDLTCCFVHHISVSYPFIVIHKQVTTGYEQIWTTWVLDRQQTKN